MGKYKITTVKVSQNKTLKMIEGLVLLLDLDDSFIIDLKYATKDNFVKKAVYPVPICAIRKETGEKLVHANRIFKEKGYTIKVWDAYRPLHVQRLFYEAYPDPAFVAKPLEEPVISGFKPSHNNGMSVDITLVDRYGKEIIMPTEFDNFTDKAAANFQEMSKEARRNVNLLIDVMESVGFRNYEKEWWHFDDIIETPTPYLDIPLEAFIE
jgi:D-alanyl-D-alanine dipeptidase